MGGVAPSSVDRRLGGSYHGRNSGGTTQISTRAANPTASPADERVETLAELLLDKKAEDVVEIDVRGRCPYADTFLIASARSTRQVRAVCAHVERQMRERFREKPVGSEGEREGKWVLLDYGDVVVHVFHSPVREFYDLDGLWSDVPHRKLG